jgi:uncharacterized Zn finger protein
VVREAAAGKARRYLAEGRVVMIRVTESTALARVRGDGEVHTVTANPKFSSCTCPAVGRCAHELAVGLVVTLPRTERR